MKRALKIGVVLVLIFGFCWIVNLMHGNPVSRMIAQHNMESYVREHYPDQGVIVSKACFNMEMGWYEAVGYKENSEDFYFPMWATRWGTLDEVGDEDLLRNTYGRIWGNYMKMVEPLENALYWGYYVSSELSFYEGEEGEYSFSRPKSELIMDKEYDLQELGNELGVIRVKCDVDHLPVSRGEQALCEIGAWLKQKHIPFRLLVLDIVVEEDPYSHDPLNVSSFQKEADELSGEYTEVRDYLGI